MARGGWPGRPGRDGLGPYGVAGLGLPQVGCLGLGGAGSGLHVAGRTRPHGSVRIGPHGVGRPRLAGVALLGLTGADGSSRLGGMRGPLPGVVRESLDGDHLAALGLPRRHQTGAYRHPVEAHRAGTAFTLLTGVLRTGKPHPLAQHVQQGLALPDVIGLVRPSVDRDVHAHCAVLPSPSRYASQVQPSVRRAMTPTAWRR
ncbi:hypothetical protein SANTM175S_04857 [Streptomyces antimycoticus]